MSAMLKVHETVTATGEIACTYLRVVEGELEIVDRDAALPLPGGALAAVMARYGAPLDPAAPVSRVGALDLGEDRVLLHVRHLARFDVIARDYLVLASPGVEALCALATTVAGALGHLARAAAARGGTGRSPG